ncbi:MAG: hypothetical protein J1F05_08675, partial [Muribaculaceae bacterium]|nr:hypothetical protein [Muribaculaceae bacterium]
VTYQAAEISWHLSLTNYYEIRYMNFTLRHYLVENKRRVIGVAIALLVVFLASWLLNYLTPEFADDLKYKFFQVPGMHSLTVKSFTDVIYSQSYDHFLHNGRSLVHSLVQLFSGVWGKKVFNYFNAAMFMLFIYLLARFMGKVSALNIVFISSLILFFFPDFKGTMLWMSGSVNYLWTSVAICLVLICLPKLQDRTRRNSDWFLFLLGMIAGWSHEGISIPLAMCFGYMFWQNRRNILYSSAFPLMLGFIGGTFVCCISPGEFYRLLHPSYGGGEVAVFERLSNGVAILLHLRIFKLLIVALVAKMIIERRNALLWLKQFYKKYQLFCNAIVCSFPILLLCGIDEIRVGYSIELYSFLLVLSIARGIKWEVKAFKAIVSLFGLAFYCYTLSFSLPNYRTYIDMKKQLESHNSSIILYDINISPKIVKNYIIRPIPSSAISSKRAVCKRYALLYGYDRLVFMPRKAYADIMNNEFITDLKKQGEYALNIINLNESQLGKTPYLLYEIDGYTAEKSIREDGYQFLFLNDQWWLFVHRENNIDVPSQIIMKKGL